jgi:hypothetical protein
MLPPLIAQLQPRRIRRHGLKCSGGLQSLTLSDGDLAIQSEKNRHAGVAMTGTNKRSVKRPEALKTSTYHFISDVKIDKQRADEETRIMDQRRLTEELRAKRLAYESKGSFSAESGYI